MSVIDALLAVAGSDWSAGARAAHDAAAAEPDALLPRALATFLDGGSEGNIYAEPEGFERFIQGGANPALYAATIDALRAVVAQQRPTSLLDLGCGDGRVTAAVVSDTIGLVTLVEPSEALLAEAVAAFSGARCAVSPHRTTAEEFVLDTALSDSWSLVQSTFAFHTLTAFQRHEVLGAIAPRATSIGLVEFDVPDFEDGGVGHARYAAERYERGLAEYPNDMVVVQRFLMPVLVGQFDPNQKRLTHEQSATRWSDELLSAGYGSVSVTPVFAYWWAPAVLVRGTALH